MINKYSHEIEVEEFHDKGMLNHWLQRSKKFVVSITPVRRNDYQMTYVVVYKI